MGYRYFIDTEKQIARIVLEGTLTPEVIAALREDMRANPAFDPAHHMVIDGRAISSLERLGPAMVRSLARGRGSMHVPGALRVFVLTNDVYYGLTRMFTAFGDTAGEMAVFRDVDEAMAWVETQRGEPE